MTRYCNDYTVIAVACCVFGGVFTTALIGDAVYAATANESWVDPNYALCEGIGASATGRVNGHAIYERSGDTLTITSLTLTTTGHQHDHIMTGTLTFQNPEGRRSSVTLEKPWFDTIGRPKSQSLNLPRVQTSSRGPGPWEQRTVEVKAGNPIQISLQLLFTVSGGNCPTSFDTNWTLE